MMVVSTHPIDEDEGEHHDKVTTKVKSVEDEVELESTIAPEIEEHEHNSTTGSSHLLFENYAESEEVHIPKAKLLFVEDHPKDASEES